MKKVFTNYVMIIWLLLFGRLHSQVWQPVGPSEGISAGAVGRLTLINDRNDNLLVGYQDASNDSKGSVQKYDGTSWSYLGGAGLAANAALYNSIAVDSQGVIYFTNQAGYPDSGLEVRKFENENWINLPNATNESINFNTSIVAPNGVLYVASGDNSGTVMKFVNGTWEQVGTSGIFNGVGFYLDMVIGKNGKIYLSFNNNGFVHVYTNDVNAGITDAWQPVGGNINLVPSMNTENYNSSLAIDNNDTPYIAYVSTSAGGNKLNVKKYDGVSWTQVGNENFSQGRVQHVSLALDKNNKIYVAASNWDNVDFLKNYVMSYDVSSNSWVKVGTGYAAQGQATFNSLAADSSGNLFLAFVDSSLGKLSVKRLNLAITAAESIQISTENGGPAEINTDNGTLQLKATVLPQSAEQNVIWSILEGETFASISNTGLLQAIASDATIKVKATSAQNNSIFATFEVTIKNQDSDISAQNVSVKTADGSFPEMYALGNKLQLSSHVSPSESDQQVVWSVSESQSVVSVDQNGLVTALAGGNAKVRATHKDGTIYGELNVSVFPNGCIQGTEEWKFGTGYDITYDSNNKGADDFIVADGVRFEMTKLRMQVISVSPKISSVTVNFLEDKNGKPGAKILSSVEDLVPVSQKTITQYTELLGYQYEIELNFPKQVFSQGRYWINPVVKSSEGDNVYWVVTPNTDLGSDYQAIVDQNGWVPLEGFDATYWVTGNCTAMPVIVSTINAEDTEIFTGETLQLKAEVTGNKAVNWSITSGMDKVSVDENGKVTGLANGIAIVRATLVEDSQYYHEINITVLNPKSCGQEVPSNNLENGFTFGPNRLAADFDVQEGKKFIIKSISPTFVGYATSVNFVFYKDNNGLPGDEITSVNGSISNDIITGDNFNYYFHQYTVDLDNEVTFTEGKYWVEVVSDAVAWETTTARVSGNAAAFDNGSGWAISSGGSEFVYKINGICDSVLATSEIISSNIQFYPNPVKDILNISSDNNMANVKIYNMVGQKIQENSLSGSKVKLNISNLLSGLYIVELTTNDGHVRRFKIIKN